MFSFRQDELFSSSKLTMVYYGSFAILASDGQRMMPLTRLGQGRRSLPICCRRRLTRDRPCELNGILILGSGRRRHCPFVRARLLVKCYTNCAATRSAGTESPLRSSRPSRAGRESESWAVAADRGVSSIRAACCGHRAVPTLVVKAMPVSRHAPPANFRSSSWRARCSKTFSSAI